MKKSKLIELLNRVEGDPEILLWNGFVNVIILNAKLRDRNCTDRASKGGLQY